MKQSTVHSTIQKQTIADRILIIRGRKVILDADLAELYEVPTKRLNEQVRRNKGRFPEDFMFQLTSKEAGLLRSQIATSKEGSGGRRYFPYVFTEHGTLMAANVLNNKRAVTMSIYVIRAFVRLRETFVNNEDLEERLAEIERILLDHNAGLRELYKKIRPLSLPLKRTAAVGFQIAGPSRGKISQSNAVAKCDRIETNLKSQFVTSNTGLQLPPEP